MSGGFAGITPAPVPRAISGRRMGGAKNFRSKEMWGKAKLLVLQRVNEDAQMKGVKQLVDSAVRQNSLVAMEKAEERRRAQKRLQGKGVDEGTLTVDHIRLLMGLAADGHNIAYSESVFATVSARKSLNKGAF